MVECRIDFSSPLPKGQGGIDCTHIGKVLGDVSRCPREWRIQDSNYGDTTRPFVYLVNKVLGLGDRDGDQWEVDKLPLDPSEVFAIKQTNGAKKVGRFSVVCGDQKIALKWKSV